MLVGRRKNQITPRRRRQRQRANREQRSRRRQIPKLRRQPPGQKRRNVTRACYGVRTGSGSNEVSTASGSDRVSLRSGRQHKAAVRRQKNVQRNVLPESPNRRSIHLQSDVDPEK